VIDGNFHYNPKLHFIVKYLTTHDEFRRQDEMSLERWQKKGFDADGSTLPENLQKKGYYPEIFINESKAIKNVNLNGNYISINGDSVYEISLAPFSSMILLKN
jgi:hypothetical protein